MEPPNKRIAPVPLVSETVTKVYEMEPASTDQAANGDETPKRRHLSKRFQTHLELYFEVRKLARRGYGFEDCVVMLEISRDPETVKWVRNIVLGRRWKKAS